MVANGGGPGKTEKRTLAITKSLVFLNILFLDVDCGENALCVADAFSHSCTCLTGFEGRFIPQTWNITDISIIYKVL